MSEKATTTLLLAEDNFVNAHLLQSMLNEGSHYFEGLTGITAFARVTDGGLVYAGTTLLGGQPPVTRYARCTSRCMARSSVRSRTPLPI